MADGTRYFKNKEEELKMDIKELDTLADEIYVVSYQQKPTTPVGVYQTPTWHVETLKESVVSNHKRLLRFKEERDENPYILVGYATSRDEASDMIDSVLSATLDHDWHDRWIKREMEAKQRKERES